MFWSPKGCNVAFAVKKCAETNWSRDLVDIQLIQMTSHDTDDTHIVAYYDDKWQLDLPTHRLREATCRCLPRNRLQQVNAKMAQQQRTEEISPQKWKEADTQRSTSDSHWVSQHVCYIRLLHLFLSMFLLVVISSDFYYFEIFVLVPSPLALLI